MLARATPKEHPTNLPWCRMRNRAIVRKTSFALPREPHFVFGDNTNSDTVVVSVFATREKERRMG